MELEVQGDDAYNSSLQLAAPRPPVIGLGGGGGDGGPPEVIAPILVRAAALNQYGSGADRKMMRRRALASSGHGAGGIQVPEPQAQDEIDREEEV